MYTLTITTWEPLTEAEIEDNRRNRGYNGGFDPRMLEVPSNMREKRVLQVQLTEAEWKAVKKATIEAVG